MSGLDKTLLSVNREADQLVVTKLDRLAQSLEHLIQPSKELSGARAWRPPKRAAGPAAKS